MLDKLVRPLIKSFSPYVWEVSTAELARRFGLDPTQVIRFDTNTNPFLPFGFIENLADYATTIPTINEYGDASYNGLRATLAAYHHCRPEQVVVGAGADELIDMVAKLFINNGDRAVNAGPTYPVYGLATELLGGQVIDVPRGAAPSFEVDVDEIARVAIAQQAKLVWLCNPNNPTATAVPVEAIARLLDKLEGRAALAIDEAYAEFWKQSALPLVERYPNLLVIRTLSKAFSLAGGRVGCVVAQADTAAYLNLVRPPNSVSNLSVAIARRALEPDALQEMQRRVDFLLAEKPRFVEHLGPCCEEIYPSVANFVLARIGSAARADQVAEALLQAGLVVRRPGSMPGHFRLTVRLPEENERLVTALRAAV